MFSLSRESENDLKTGMLKIVEDFLDDYQKPKPKMLGLITQDELQTELKYQVWHGEALGRCWAKTIHATNRRHAHRILQNR